MIGSQFLTFSRALITKKGGGEIYRKREKQGSGVFLISVKGGEEETLKYKVLL